MLAITQKTDTATTLVLEGRLDTATAPQLEAELKDILPDAQLVLDLEKLDYISSAGLRVLLSIQKRIGKQGSLKMIHVQEGVRDIFDITGFSDIFTIQ